ncbi:hypothetical protein GQ42DRAFT_160739 [Ramicandelaber brevisporus]|nr:hypothetical protein GQ42DRAFT_160739 [Ramicandelaber brevisporus]
MTGVRYNWHGSNDTGAVSRLSPLCGTHVNPFTLPLSSLAINHYSRQFAMRTIVASSAIGILLLSAVVSAQDDATTSPTPAGSTVQMMPSPSSSADETFPPDQMTPTSSSTSVPSVAATTAFMTLPSSSDLSWRASTMQMTPASGSIVTSTLPVRGTRSGSDADTASNTAGTLSSDRNSKSGDRSASDSSAHSARHWSALAIIGISGAAAAALF